MKKSINISIFSAFVSGVCTTSVDAAALSNPPETAATTAPAAQGEFFIAKAIAKEAKADGNYVRMLALRYFGADGLANINDFGEGFFEYGCGDESWEKLLDEMRTCDGFVEPSPSEIAAASRRVRAIILGHENL
jgi:hypothetical protein